MVARTQCSLGCMSLFLWPLTSGFGSGEDDVDSVVAGPVDLSWERARTTGVDAVASGDAVGQRVQRQTVDAGGREAVLVDQVVTGVGVIAGDIGVPAVTATGEGRLTYCQPDSVSPEKVALASWCRCCSIRCPVSTGVMTALEQADAGVEAVLAGPEADTELDGGVVDRVDDRRGRGRGPDRASTGRACPLEGDGEQ